MFIEKLNKKLDGSVYVIEEVQQITDGKYEGLLQHDNINKKSLKVYTGPKLTGDEIKKVIHSVPSDTPWKSYIKIFASVEKVYITYETPGDTVESEDINELQKYTTFTQNELDQYETSNDSEVSRLKERMKVVEETKAEEVSVAERLLTKADKVNTYTKTETDQRIQDVVAAAPEALDTLKEIADSLNDDPNFAATMTNQLATKVDKISGKGLSTEDYTTEEKAKLAGVEKNANNYIHPSSGVAAGTYRSVSVDAKGHVTEGSNPTTLAGYGINDATPSSHIGATGTVHGIATTAVNGFMSAADKTKLDGIDTGANNYIHPASGIGTGTYRSLTVDANGHVTAGSNPTTLGGYGISDAVNKGGDSMSGFLTLSGDPTQSMHAATKQYVDNLALGLDVKRSVRAASTTNIPVTTAAATTLTLTSALTAIDGVTLAVGDRILLKDQSDASQNGIYVYTNSTLLTRANDADSNTKVTSGMFTFVEEGVTNDNSGWVLTTNGAITLGTTALSFAQFSGAGQVIAGTGISKSGNTLSLSASGVSAGTYTKTTVDAYGRVTAGTTLSASDIPTLDWSKITGAPTSYSANGGNSDTVDGIHSSQINYGASGCGTTNLSSFNTLNKSGFYDGSSATGAPIADWCHLINNSHFNSVSGNEYGMQLSSPFWSQELYFRTFAPNNKTPDWNRVWHSGNDGSGSGLDADLLDGCHASVDASSGTVVVRNSAGYIMNTWFNSSRGAESSTAESYIYDTGDGYMRKKTVANVRSELNCLPMASTSNADLDFSTYPIGITYQDHYAGDPNYGSYISKLTARDNNTGLQIIADWNKNPGGAPGLLAFRVKRDAASNWSNLSTIWHSGNDGSGSGLDADKLDGMQPDINATANTVVIRDGNGYIRGSYINSSRGLENTGAESYIYDNGDGWMRKKSIANVRTELGGHGKGLDADKLDGQEGSYYLNYNNFTNKPTAMAPTANSVNYMRVYNSSIVNSSSSLTMNDLGNQHFAGAMINSATDNPTGLAKWVHAINMGWGETNTSWVSQLAIGVQDGTGLYYRASNAGNPIAGRPWNRVLDSSNYNNYTPTLTGTGASGTWGINITGNADTVDGLHENNFMRNDFNGSIDITDANYKVAYATNVAGSSSAPSTDWWHIIYIPHRNNDGYGAQIAVSYHGGANIYVRSAAGTSWGSWKRVTPDYGTSAPTSLREGEVFYVYE